MKKLHYVFIALLSSTFLFSSVSFQLENSFTTDSFDKIIRFDRLHFTQEDRLDNKSKKTFAVALKKIKELQEDNHQVKIVIIGHMYNPNDYYPKKIDINLNYEIDRASKEDKSALYARYIKQTLLEKGIDENLLYIYSKRGAILADTDETLESAELSNRVMLAIYVLEPEDIDSDKDGIFDRYDRCIGTPRGSKVDKNGCPVDSDHDGVLDYKDRCPGTPPKGVSVDAYGCPLDSDHDGVVDYKDKCENTPLKRKVDPYGCAIKQILKLYFKTNSDKILKSSYPEIKKFAEFLKNNPTYNVKIIGHTDSIGKAVHNMKLSIQRAKSVKKALVAEGISASRIVATGRGELDPIQSNRTESGRQANRRIEIELFN